MDVSRGWRQAALLHAPCRQRAYRGGGTVGNMGQQGNRRSARILLDDSRAANELTGQKHDRMPCILQPNEYDIWLNPALNDPAQLVPLLRPCPPEQTRMYAVARDVNSGRAEGPHLNQPQQP